MHPFSLNAGTSSTKLVTPASKDRIKAVRLYIEAPSTNDVAVDLEVGGTVISTLPATGGNHTFEANGSGQNLIDVEDITVKRTGGTAFVVRGYYITQ